MLPGNVGGVIAGNEYLAILRCLFDLNAGTLGIEPPSAPGEGARIGWVPHHVPERFAKRRTPLQLTILRTSCLPEWPQDLTLAQVTHDPADAAKRGEALESQADYFLHLFVGIELQFAVRSDDVARRRLAKPFAAAGAVQASGLHPLLDLMQLETPHDALDSQD
jgi:hypothetical protein